MGRRRSLNMTDLAREAGVSIATVSRALNGAPGVSEATRHRIRKLADDLSYAVSPHASRLARGSHGSVAVVIPGLTHWFYSTMVEGIVSVLHDAEVDVLLYLVKEEHQRHRFFEELPARRQVDAVVVVALPISDEEQRRLELMDVTVVMAGGTLGDHPHVRVDDVIAARQAVNHLVRARHERIGMINVRSPWELAYPAPRDRRLGFEGALRDAGLPVDPQLVVEVPWGAGGGAHAMNQILSLEQPPTAVFAFSDEIAAGTIRSLRRAGLRVPGNMSVIGVDDHPLADLMDLTTVHQPVGRQGTAAGQLVLDILEHRAVDTVHISLPTHLVIRSTTGPPDT
jgi:LacI family transcriptional regulator, repressor for deo operon, udp, cdd, tsx, nupC, and nupG